MCSNRELTTESLARSGCLHAVLKPHDRVSREHEFIVLQSIGQSELGSHDASGQHAFSFRIP
jgi:hypothetical protein